jgi:hypothetical protein
MTGGVCDETLRGMQKILIVPIIAALVLTLFAWPAARLGPRDLPVGVVGAGPALPAKKFDVHQYADETDARSAIEDREIYGALAGDKVLIATAASPAVAQMLTHAAEGRPVEDVVPAGPESSALAASVLPLVLAGIIVGVLSIHLRRRVTALFAGALLAGLSAALVVQSWLGVVDGDFWANSAALSLTVLAIGATVSGLESVLGKIGIALGALTMVFIGNPFSGVATAPEMIPAGTFGQLLPPGAGGNLLRSTGFFDGAAAGGHVAVLAGWAAFGLALIALRQVMHVLKPVDGRVDADRASLQL